MKKFFLILSVVLLSLSVICLAVSADPLVREENVDPIDPGSLRNVPPSGSVLYPYYFVFKEVLTPPGSSISNPCDFSCNGVTYDNIYFQTSTGKFHYQNNTLGTDLIVYENGAWIDDSYRYITINSYPSNGAVRNFLNSNELSLVGNVSSGVTETINFSGQVLSFITSTSGILSLVGLSIAFAIIPFAIGKVKELIKGY